MPQRRLVPRPDHGRPGAGLNPTLFDDRNYIYVNWLADNTHTLDTMRYVWSAWRQRFPGNGGCRIRAAWVNLASNDIRFGSGHPYGNTATLACPSLLTASKHSTTRSG